MAFGLTMTYFTAKIVDNANMSFNTGIIIIIIEWLIFLHIYHSIWPEAFS